MIKKALLICSMLITNSSAYDVNELAAKMQDRVGDPSIKGLSQKITPEMQEQIDNFKGTYQNKLSDIQEWENKMDYVDGRVVFKDKSIEKKKQNLDANGIFNSDERIYIFMSSSVPKETLMEYIKTIDKYKLTNIVFVMRGCIGGCEKVKPTIQYMRDIITDGGSIPNGLKAPMEIDPLLFRKYQITKAPTFVYAKNVLTERAELSEGLDKNLKSKPVSFKSEGDWEFLYHLKVLEQKSKSQSLKRLIALLQKNDFLNKSK
jgi:type-F conjugative transfer system pilin assembly protein TrbC